MLKEYTGPTKLCDSDSPAIKEKAKEICANAATPKEAALRIFHFVRDEIWYAATRQDTKASETLQRKQGVCAAKCNLHVALLRAVGIPARYHIVKLNKSWMKGVMPIFAYWLAPSQLHPHPCCECYLEGKWISCETTFDKSLYQGAIRRGRITKDQVPIIDWDGETDLTVTHAWMKEDGGILASIDELARDVQRKFMPPRIIAYFGYPLANRHMNKLRQAATKG